MPDDWDRLRAALVDANVAGSQDLGRFVSNTEFFAPSTFDERAAMAVLVTLLPTLTDPGAVSAVAWHLRRPWARPAAFDALLRAFRLWAGDQEASAAWHLGDALANAARDRHVDDLLAVVQEPGYGKSRQMVVYALWRFRKHEEIPGVLAALCSDPTVCLHAMSAYRRAIGNAQALPLLRKIQESLDAAVRRQAQLQVAKAEKAAARSE